MAPKQRPSRKVSGTGRKSALGSSVADDKAVRYGQLAITSPSGTMQTKPVPPYSEQEEGSGKRFRRQSKVDRLRRRSEEISLARGSLPEAQPAVGPILPPTTPAASLSIVPPPQGGGGESRTSTDPKKAVADAEKKANELVAKISPIANVPVIQVPSPPAPKPTVSMPPSQPKRSFSQRVSTFFGRQSKQSKFVIPALPVPSSRSEPDSVPEPTPVDETGQDLEPEHESTPVPVVPLQQPKAEPEPEESSSDEDDDDEAGVTDFLSLLGVDPMLINYRDLKTTRTDHARIERQDETSEVLHAKNVAIWDNLKLEYVDIDNFDDEFLRLWDLEAGDEMLQYMAKQTEGYRVELKSLDEENDKVEDVLDDLKRKMQDGYFQIRDYDLKAAEAENRYKQLVKLRPKREKKKGQDEGEEEVPSHITMVSEALNALCDQRAALLRESQLTHLHINENLEAVRQEEHLVDRDFHTAVRIFNEAMRNFDRAKREAVKKQADLAMVHEDLTYLTEEVSLYVFEDDHPQPEYEMDVREAFKYLAYQSPEMMKLRRDPTKRLDLLEETLEAMKNTGTKQIRLVADAHDEIRFHVSRRQNIFQQIIIGFMQQKEIRKIDENVWNVLLKQEAKLKLLQDQVSQQQALNKVLEPRFSAMKDSNAKLREAIDKTKAGAEKIPEDGGGKKDGVEGHCGPAREVILKSFEEQQMKCGTDIVENEPGEQLWEELSSAKDSESWKGDRTRSLSSSSDWSIPSPPFRRY
ncbi:hypothetical protein RvY_15581 [Ramazzottius varieornatus]|uniref:Uncharacterized protein n=1 Tax=Ramazzottius varieornatus TaxID=947166 RepID=A0A1D1W022_RAMVA|nr:hypothetical protein RvY_15581 [Ramazzottius varieornatus]